MEASTRKGVRKAKSCISNDVSNPGDTGGWECYWLCSTGHERLKQGADVRRADSSSALQRREDFWLTYFCLVAISRPTVSRKNSFCCFRHNAQYNWKV